MIRNTTRPMWQVFCDEPGCRAGLDLIGAAELDALCARFQLSADNVLHVLVESFGWTWHEDKTLETHVRGEEVVGTLVPVKRHRCDGAHVLGDAEVSHGR